MLRNLAFVAATACVCTPALAESTFRFATDRTVYQAVPGAPVEVKVYLLEEYSGNSIFVAEDGLFSVGLKLEGLDEGPVLLPDGFVHDPQFSGGVMEDYGPLSLVLNDGLLDDPGPVGEEITPGVRRVHLGTFNFTAGDANRLIAMSLTDFDSFGASEDTLTWAGTELDKLIVPAQFTIDTTVPEPAASVMLLSAAAGLLRRRRRN